MKLLILLAGALGSAVFLLVASLECCGCSDILTTALRRSSLHAVDLPRACFVRPSIGDLDKPGLRSSYIMRWVTPSQNAPVGRAILGPTRSDMANSMLEEEGNRVPNVFVFLDNKH